MRLGKFDETALLEFAGYDTGTWKIKGAAWNVVLEDLMEAGYIARGYNDLTSKGRQTVERLKQEALEPKTKGQA